MKGFKLLAIRPLEGTSTQFLKNLQPQVIYKFYNDYEFQDALGNDISIGCDFLNNDVKSVVPKNNSKLSIYSSSDVSINVSAIVGQNGTGKSSIIDFNNLVIYYLSCYTFKKMKPAYVKVNNDLHLFLHYLKEQFNSLKEFLSTKAYFNDEIFSFNTTELNESDVSNIASQIENYFYILSLENKINFKEDITDEKKLRFNELLWRFLIEGRKNYELKLDFTFHQLGHVFQAFNNAIFRRLKSLNEQYLRDLNFEKLLKNEFNFEIYYQKNEDIFKITKIGNEIDLVEEDFYYNILLNYSLHSMNSIHLGEWIFKLFHKNDGYQTPIVINPYREHGVIDINNEQDLTVDRLIYNIIDQFREKESAILLGKYKLKKIILELKSTTAYPVKEFVNEKNERKENNSLDNKSDLIEFAAKNDWKLTIKKDNEILDYCLGYLIKKFQKISNNYMTHFYDEPKLLSNEFSEQLDELLEWKISKTKDYLKTNSSHVTKKFDQTLNFMLNQKELINSLEFLKEWNIHEEIELTSNQLVSWISVIEGNLGLKEVGTNEIISNLFPAIFNIDIEFDYNGTPIKLSNMSSGERQHLFNINTITYHINNLKTIKKVENGKLKKYDHVNIILDEIELYYHPQYQKQLIKDLTDEIKSLDTLGDLKSFNIQFLTHSPFILSDIPKENILKLIVNENGKSEPQEMKEETFGANIHDLLANDFFLKDGFMGEFAKNWISGLITKIEEIENGSMNEEKYKEILSEISLIGEPVLANSLRSMLDLKFNEIIVLNLRENELLKELEIIRKEKEK